MIQLPYWSKRSSTRWNSVLWFNSQIGQKEAWLNKIWLQNSVKKAWEVLTICIENSVLVLGWIGRVKMFRMLLLIIFFIPISKWGLTHFSADVKRSEDSKINSWRELLDDPKQWWDNRDSKRSGSVWTPLFMWLCCPHDFVGEMYDFLVFFTGESKESWFQT